MRKAILLLLLLAGVSGNAAAVDWQLVNGIFPLQWFDASSIEKLGTGNFRVWLKYSLPREVIENIEADLVAAKSKVSYQSYMHSVTRWEFDCKARKQGLVSAADYSSTGMVINSYERSPYPLEVAIPDTEGDARLIAVCKVTTQSKRRQK